MSTPHLHGPRIEPRGGPAALVVLLHGYGANGDDLIALGEVWRRQLPQAVFVAPNAPEEVPGMPGALQWFPLTFRDPGERWRGVVAARPGLDRFLDAELARYGLVDKLLQLLTAQFEASMHFDLNRMPELFCGFTRELGESPVQYPVACAPQAWSAASVLLLLQACLGLEVSALDQQIFFTRPQLPASLGELRIHNLQVGSATVDLLLQRREHDIFISVIHREGDVEVLVAK